MRTRRTKLSIARRESRELLCFVRLLFALSRQALADGGEMDGREAVSLSLVSAKREKTEQAGGLLEGESLSKKKKSEKSRGPKEKVSGKAVGRLCSKLRNSTPL